MILSSEHATHRRLTRPIRDHVEAQAREEASYRPPPPGELACG